MPKAHFETTNFKDWPEDAKADYIQRITIRRWKRKKELVDRSGGKCQKCGYDRCLRALSFHHRDPDKKSFTLNVRTVASKKWEALCDEADKCDLLCANCHMEEEHAKETKYLRE